MFGDMMGMMSKLKDAQKKLKKQNNAYTPF